MGFNSIFIVWNLWGFQFLNSPNTIFTRKQLQSVTAWILKGHGTLLENLHFGEVQEAVKNGENCIVEMQE